MMITKENNKMIHELMDDIVDNHWMHKLKDIICAEGDDHQWVDRQIDSLYSAIHPTFPDGGEIEKEVFKNLVAKACIQSLSAFNSSMKLKCAVTTGM